MRACINCGCDDDADAVVVVVVVVIRLFEVVRLMFRLRGSLDGLNATLLGSYFLIGDLMGERSCGIGEFNGPVGRVSELVSTLGVVTVKNVLLAE